MFGGGSRYGCARRSALCAKARSISAGDLRRTIPREAKPHRGFPMRGSPCALASARASDAFEAVGANGSAWRAAKRAVSSLSFMMRAAATLPASRTAAPEGLRSRKRGERKHVVVAARNDEVGRLLANDLIDLVDVVCARSSGRHEVGNIAAEITCRFGDAVRPDQHERARLGPSASISLCASRLPALSSINRSCERIVAESLLVLGQEPVTRGSKCRARSPRPGNLFGRRYALQLLLAV